MTLICQKLDNCYNGELNLRILCHDCSSAMQTNLKEDNWNENEHICVLTVYCPNCKCTGSVQLNLSST